MGYMEKIGIVNNGRTYTMRLDGYLIGRNRSGEIKTKFKYGELQNASFSLTQASGIAIEYNKPTLTIQTNRIDIPFIISSKIELVDGNRWSVTNINPVRNKYTGKLERVQITLQGGGNV